MSDQPQDDTSTREADAQGASAEPIAPFRTLLMVSTTDRSEVFDFGAQRALTLGRGEPADLKVEDPSLSRVHAQFVRQGESVKVTDLDSRNGTWVKGQRVHDALLNAGDNAVMGGVTVTVQVAAPARANVLGLLSEGAIRRRLHEEWERAENFRRPLSIALARLETFTAQGAISQLPVHMAKLRPTDRIGLYDASTLMLVLPETSAETALSLGRELVAAARSHGQLHCGVASYPTTGTSPEELMSGALEALRTAVSAGEAKLVCAPKVIAVREPNPGALVMRSAAMLEVDRLVERLAARPITVLVLGETGTGKELIARELHARSTRAAAPLRVVNCAAIPEALLESVLFGHVRGAFTGADRDSAGVFEQAQGGTVFLDEVGELPPSSQAALLRVAETKSVCRVGGQREISLDVRLCAATHRDLAAMAEQGRFRLDLYHRLSTVVLQLPPLRERIEEIEPLVDQFLQSIAISWGGPLPRLTSEALGMLRRYRWPGNVRELRNVIERAVALAEGELIGPDDLPKHIAEAHLSTPPAAHPAEAPWAGPVDLRHALDEHEAQLIRDALRRCGGNQRKAAEWLNLPLRTLVRRLSQLGLRDDASED